MNSSEKKMWEALTFLGKPKFTFRHMVWRPSDRSKGRWEAEGSAWLTVLGEGIALRGRGSPGANPCGPTVGPHCQQEEAHPTFFCFSIWWLWSCSYRSFLWPRFPCRIWWAKLGRSKWDFCGDGYKLMSTDVMSWSRELLTKDPHFPATLTPVRYH